MKKALLDASSAILLFKADLLSKLTDIYCVAVTQSVLHELTRENHCGADTFHHYAAQKKIGVIDVGSGEFPCRKSLLPSRSLGRGEGDTIKCFAAGGWDFIITDDGRAARYCRRNNLPFINALLFPRLLYFCHGISLAESNHTLKAISSLGRYSSAVIDWAESCKKEALLFAIPDSCGV